MIESTRMPRRTKLPTLDEVATIPAQELAAIVLAAAEWNPRLALALRARTARVGSSTEKKRLWKEMVRGLVPRNYVGYEGATELAASIGDLLGSLEKLSENDPEIADGAIAEILALEADFFEACDDSNGAVGDALRQAVQLWGKVAARARRGGPELAEWLLAAGRENGYGVRDSMVHDFAEALGGPGLEHLRERLRFELARRRGDGGKDDFEARARRFELVNMLEQVADALGDVELFVEACRAGGRPELCAEEIARRRLAAGDAVGALATLDSGEMRPGRQRDTLELRLELLEALGRHEEAQCLRWEAFRRGLWRGDLEDYLARIEEPSTRAEKEAEALAIAESDGRADVALSFFLGGRDLGFACYLEQATVLVRHRHSELDGNDYGLLRRAALELAPSAPDAATRLYRKMVEAVLERGSSKYYIYAAKDLRAAKATWGAVVKAPQDLPSHEGFLGALRTRHGRKYSFWKQIDG